MTPRPAGAAVLLLATAACTSDPQPPQEEPAPSEATPSESPVPSGPTTVDLTETYEFEDGLAITLDDFSRGTDTYIDWDSDPSGETEVTDPDGDFVRFAFTVDNGTEEPVDLTVMMADCAVGDPAVATEMGSYGVEGGESGYPPDSTVLPGKSAKAMTTCQMDKDETELQVAVSGNDPDAWQREVVVFAGEVD